MGCTTFGVNSRRNLEEEVHDQWYERELEGWIIEVSIGYGVYDN